MVELARLAKADLYACSADGFAEDSWVPSVTQNPVYVHCNVDSGGKGDSNSCLNAADFTSKTNGCAGCMDTYDLFKDNLTAINVKIALDARYPDPSCSTFTN